MFYDVDALLPKTGPTNFPAIFYAWDQSWSHNGSMNSTLARNAAQSLTGGALLDFRGDAPTYASSILIRNLVDIEDVVKKIRPPSWPAEIPLDAGLRERGESIYRAKCRECHEPIVHENGLYEWKMYTLEEIGTDDENVKLVETPLTGPLQGQLAIEAIGQRVTAFEDVYFRTHADDGSPADDAHPAISESTRHAWEDVRPEGRRDPVQFRAATRDPNGPTQGRTLAAKPLDGAWATAPYLHNGAVPTLWHLLQDESDRPKHFVLGHRLYDMQNVGYWFSATIDPSLGAPAPFVLDVETAEGAAVRGNSNRGHSGERFGTTLPDGDKRALIEFLKGFGGGSAHPVILPPK
jgi:hypothetical protein